MEHDNIKPIKLWSDDYQHIVKINVDFTDKCNYKCEYCYNLKNGYVRQNVEVDIFKLISFLQFLYDKDRSKHLVLILMGGEPTIHSNFMTLVKELKKLPVEINAFSNFSNTNEFYEETIQLGVKYLLTFHYLNDYRTSYFINKLEFLKKKNLLRFIDTINVMLQIGNFEKCLEVYDFLYKNYNNEIESTVRCNLIDDCNKDIIKRLRVENYSHEQLQQYFNRCSKSDIANQYADEVFVKYENGIVKKVSDYEIKNDISYNFKHWKCNAGLQYFHINFNGDIMPCKVQLHPIGNIYNDLRLLKIHPTICMSASCPCEYYLPKERVFR